MRWLSRAVFLAGCPALSALLMIPDLRAEEKKDRHWSLQLELEGQYDDNITELSDNDKDRVGEPGSEDRFKVDSADDYVLQPSVRFGYARACIPRVETALRLDARGWIYTRNSIKNYESAGFRLSQDLSAARRYETRLVVNAGYQPEYYLRELRVPQRSLDLGRTVRDSAIYSSLKYGGGIEQVLVPKHLELAISASEETRDYDAPFDERDGTLSGYGARLEWQPMKDGALAFDAGYRIESYDADGDDPSTPAVEGDISSDRRIVSAGVDFRWGKRDRRGGVSLNASREKRDFTSNDPLDTFHFEREDDKTELNVTFRKALGNLVYFEAGLSREDNKSDLAPGASANSGDDITDYTRDIISAGVGWRF